MFNKLFPVFGFCIGFLFINHCCANSGSGDSKKSLFDILPLNGAYIPPGSLSVAYTTPSTPTNVSIVSEKKFRRSHNGFIKGKVLDDVPAPTSLFDDLPNQGASLPQHSTQTRTRRTRLKIPKTKIDVGENKNRNVRGNLGRINLDDFHVEESPVSEFDLFFNREIAPSLARTFITAGSGSNSRRIPIITAPVIPRIIHPVRSDEELIRSTLLKAAGGNNGKTVVFFAGENEKEKVRSGYDGGGTKYSTSTSVSQKSSPTKDSSSSDKKEVHYHYYFANKEEAARHHHGQHGQHGQHGHGQHGSSHHQQGSISTSTTSRPGTDGGFDNNNNNNGNSPGTSYGSPSPPDSSYGASGKRSFASRYDNSRTFVIGSSINVPLSRRTHTTPSTFYNAPSRIAPDQSYGRIAPPDQSYGRIATEPPNNSYGPPSQPSFDDPTTEFPIVQQHHNQQQQGGYGNNNNNNQGGYSSNGNNNNNNQQQGNNNNNQGGYSNSNNQQQGSNNNNQGGYSNGNNNNQQQGSNQGNNGGGNGNNGNNGNGGYSDNSGQQQQQGGYNDFTSRTLFTFRNNKKEQEYNQQDDDLDSYSAPAPPSDVYSVPQQDHTYKESYGPPPKEPYGPPAKHTTTTTTTTTPAPPRDVESQQQLTQITIETIPITHSVTRLVTVPKIVQSFQSNGDVPISSLPAPDDPSQHFEAPQNQYGPPAPPPSSSSDGKYSNNRGNNNRGNTASTLSLEHAQLFSQLLNNAREESFGDTSYSSNSGSGIDLESLQSLLVRGRNRHNHDDISFSDLQQLALLGQTRGILQSPVHSNFHSQQQLNSNGLIRASQLLNNNQQFGRFGNFPGGTRTRDTLLTGDAIDALNDLLREQRLQSSVSELRSKLRQENRDKTEKTRQTHRNLFYKGAVLLGALTLLPRVAPLATSAATAAATAAASTPIGSNLLLPILTGVGKRRKRSATFINRKSPHQIQQSKRQKIIPPSPFELCLLEGVESGNRPKTSKINKPGYFKNWIKCTGQFALSKLPFLNPTPATGIGHGHRKGDNRDRDISESMKWKLLSYMPSKDILLNKNCLQKHFCQNLLEVETLDNWESYLMLYSLFAGDVNRNPWIKNSMKAAKYGKCGVFICNHDFSYKNL